MNSLDLNLPVYVVKKEQSGQTRFGVRALFFPDFNSEAPSLEEALKKLKERIIKHFSDQPLNQTLASQLSWLKFFPDLEYKTLEMPVHEGKHQITGNFAYIHFKHKLQKFVLFPELDNNIHLIPQNEEGEMNIRDLARKTLKVLLKEAIVEKEKHPGIRSYFASTGNFISDLNFNINLNKENLPFEHSRKNDLAMLESASFEFNGNRELGKVGVKLNDLFPGKLQRAWHREEEIEKLNNLLLNPGNQPLVLLGPPGVGKNTLIHEVVFRHVNAMKEEKYWHQCWFWKIDPSRIISGMSYVGMWQDRLETMLQYVSERKQGKGKVFDKIVIQNPVSLLRIGKTSQSSFALIDVFKPWLEKKKVQMILLASQTEWQVLEEKALSFSDLFQIIRIEEPDPETMMRMILQKRRVLENNYSCAFSTQALNNLYHIQRTFFRRYALPGSMAKMLEQLAMRYRYSEIDSPEVAKEFESISAMRSQLVDTEKIFESNEVRDIIGAQLVGQEEAVNCLSDAVHLIKSRLNDPNKPFASFLFIGPTGVGKTQAAKVLCSYLLGSADRLLRFDMNEYIDEYSARRLTGDYNNPEGLLVGKVRHQPFGIILFDEIEKAHPKVHDLLLQVLDDGRLSDPLGRTADFTNTVIIMTSNAGAKEASSVLGYAPGLEFPEHSYRKALEIIFRPEFLNRIGKVVIFNPLEKEHILNIARLQIRDLLSRDGFLRRTTILNISAEALEWVAERGFNEKMGGRALKRQIEKDLTELSADQLIKTTINKPILFTIELKREGLIPRITPLEFENPLNKNWLPEFPDEKQSGKFYSNLMASTESLEQEIDEHSPGSKSGTTFIKIENTEILKWQHFWFKTQVADYKELIKRRILGIGHQIREEKPVVPLRLKVAENGLESYFREGNAKKKSDEENLFENKKSLPINELNKLSRIHFDKEKSQYLNDYLELEFLRLFAEGYFADQVDKIELNLESLISNVGADQMEYLLQVYVSFLEEMEIQYHVHPGLNLIEAEGFSIFKLLKGEEGIHLFNIPHQNPIPIKLQVKLKNAKPEDKDHFIVIRVYDGNLMLTDLRTGFTNDAGILPKELKVLLFGGLKGRGVK